MKKVQSLVVVLVIGVVTGLLVQAMVTEAAAAKKPGVVDAELAVMTATVQAVDYKNRTITLKGPNGNVATLHVHGRVKNLGQVKVGDKLEVEFYKSVVLYVAKGGEKPEAVDETSVGVAPKGQKPGIEAVNVLEITAKVEAIDYKKHTLTLTGPQGGTVTLNVDKRTKHFKEIKEGDMVVARVTEAIVMDIRKP
jgi:ribosomal 50S subunit-recycling heat shock protein